MSNKGNKDNIENPPIKLAHKRSDLSKSDSNLNKRTTLQVQKNTGTLQKNLSLLNKKKTSNFSTSSESLSSKKSVSDLQKEEREKRRIKLTLEREKKERQKLEKQEQERIEFEQHLLKSQKSKVARSPLKIDTLVDNSKKDSISAILLSPINDQNISLESNIDKSTTQKSPIIQDNIERLSLSLNHPKSTTETDNIINKSKVNNIQIDQFFNKELQALEKTNQAIELQDFENKHQEIDNFDPIPINDSNSSLAIKTPAQINKTKHNKFSKYLGGFWPRSPKKVLFDHKTPLDDSDFSKVLSSNKNTAETEKSFDFNKTFGIPDEQPQNVDNQNFNSKLFQITKEGYEIIDNSAETSSLTPKSSDSEMEDQIKGAGYKPENRRADDSELWIRNLTKAIDRMNDIKSSKYHLVEKIPKFGGFDEPVEEFISEMKDAYKLCGNPSMEDFLPMICTRLKGTARELVEKREFNSIKELSDYLRSHFGNIIEGMEAIHKILGLKKRSNENYHMYGERLMVETVRALKSFFTPEMSLEAREILTQKVETSVLKQYIKSIKNSFIQNRLGEPKNMEEAVLKVGRLEADEDDNDDERMHSTSFRLNKVVGKNNDCCQICNSTRHGALECRDIACIYCNDMSHVSNDCTIAPREKKFFDICKECRKQGHTIDFCIEKERGKTYCQYCQSAGHIAKACDLSHMTKYCKICKKEAHKEGQECPSVRPMQETAVQLVNAAVSTQNIQLVCDICGNTGHSGLNCRMREFYGIPPLPLIQGNQGNPNMHNIQHDQGNYNQNNFNHNNNYNQGNNNRGNWNQGNGGNFRGNFRGNFSGNRGFNRGNYNNNNWNNNRNRGNNNFRGNNRGGFNNFRGNRGGYNNQRYHNQAPVQHQQGVQYQQQPVQSYVSLPPTQVYPQIQASPAPIYAQAPNTIYVQTPSTPVYLQNPTPTPIYSQNPNTVFVTAQNPNTTYTQLPNSSYTQVHTPTVTFPPILAPAPHQGN